MLKKSKKPGKSTTANIEIQNISNRGIWLLANDDEFYIPFTKFPWFQAATIRQIYNLKFLHGHHLHWPDLDIDIDLDSLKNPESYPLIFS